MKKNLVNCKDCTYLYDRNSQFECPNCDSSGIGIEEESPNIALSDLLEATKQNTHAVRAIGLFLLIGSINALVMALAFIFSSVGSSGITPGSFVAPAMTGAIGLFITLMTVGRELHWSKS